MKKILKYGVVPVVVGAFLLCFTFMLLPVLINVQKFLPQIEKQVTRTTGRSFSVGSDFGLTFFPWLSVTFSDMRLGNPEGIIADDFIQIDSFEARVKLLPLLVNKVEVSRFVMSGLNVNLQREPNGRNNWEILSANERADSSHNVASKVSGLFSKDFFIELFAITGGTLTWNDRQHESDVQIDDLMVLLNDVSSTGSAKIEIKAMADGHQVRGIGSIGPVSSNLSSLFMDLRLEVNDRIQTIVKGECSYPLNKTECDLAFNIPTFSLNDLYLSSVQDQDGIKSDLVGWQSVELSGHFLGTSQKFAIHSGSGSIDDAGFTYRLIHDSAQHTKNEVELNFNRIDLDHYFAQEDSENKVEKTDVNCPGLEILKSAPYTIKMKADEVVLAEIKFANVDMDIVADKGIMNVTKGGFDLHGGKGQFESTIGLNDQPISLESTIDFKNVEMEQFSKELIGVPFLSGPMKGRVTIKRSGLSGSRLGKAFVGEGAIHIDGGVISGIDLLSTKTPLEEKKTEFTKLSANIFMGAGVVRLQPLTLLGGEGITEMTAIVQLDDKSFSVFPDAEKAQNESLSLSGGYGPDGLAVFGFTDVYETKIHEIRDAQTLVDEKMPKPVEEDVNNMVGTPLIDPAIVAQRFGLKPEMITPDNVKKAYNVGKGRVRIHALQELESPVFPR